MFRNYQDVENNVKDTYKKARINQNLEYHKMMMEQYNNREKQLINIWDALDLLNKFIDLSDPDIELPNIQHLFQSTEASRKDDMPEWFQVTCLIHDLGKLMYIFGNDKTGTSMKEQWGIVGDTFILGCKIPESIVYPEFNNLNKDHNAYDKYGIYEKRCGLENCKISWGHDEFLYQTLMNNEHNLPNEALYIIRYHSLYLFHTENEYEHLTNEYDENMKFWLNTFNKYDLYSKENKPLDINNLKDHYNNLLNCYFNNNQNLYW